MSVTRVEGPRPLDAATRSAANQPRLQQHVPHPAAANTPDSQETEQSAEPASIYKPYSLSFRFDKDLNRVVVKVIDPESGELLREIPPESVLEALKQIKRSLGSLVDEEV